MRIFLSTNLVRFLTGMATVLSCLLASPGSATTFVFTETSSSVPLFFVNSSITINGGFANLPTIQNGPPTPSFGNLIAFDITLPSLVGEGHYTLADFTDSCQTPSCANGSIFSFPMWNISPGGIGFINKTDSTDFFISGFGSLSTIQFDSDGPTAPSDCEETGSCIATGHWDAVPEPATATLLIAGLLGTALALRKRNRS
jgi:hypothetical protein